MSLTTVDMPHLLVVAGLIGEEGDGTALRKVMHDTHHFFSSDLCCQEPMKAAKTPVTTSGGGDTMTDTEVTDTNPEGDGPVLGPGAKGDLNDPARKPDEGKATTGEDKASDDKAAPALSAPATTTTPKTTVTTEAK